MLYPSELQPHPFILQLKSVLPIELKEEGQACCSA